MVQLNEVPECFLAMMSQNTLNQSGNRSGTGPRNLCVYVLCVCVCKCVRACVWFVCVLSVRASRLTLASALHQRPSIIEQKLCDAQGNEIVYFYHSTIPHCRHTLPVCAAIHRHRHIWFFFPGATSQSKVKPVQGEHKLGETG